MNKLVLLIGAALLAWVVFGVDPDRAPEPAVEFAAARADRPSGNRTQPAGNGFAEFTTTRAPDGHFYADVRINGATVPMLIDTGASTILLSRTDAQRAGIQVASGDFTSVGRTVSGDIALK
ncbi:MAG: aspartyl protease family protein, partial [Sphingomonadales bacterium]|nr:aspartyl protease family protein [Sphingomonadales bacterium]